MAAHDKALIIDSLSNNWNKTSSPSAGTTASCSVSPAAPTTRVNMTQLSWALTNATLTTGPICTLTLAGGSGTVIASWRISPVGFGSYQDSWTLNIKGKKGSAMNASWGNPNASVLQSVSMSGWFDSMTDG